MSWSNKKEAYDDGFDDGVFIGVVGTLLTVGVCVAFIVGVAI
ncbi:hypothetical protein [Halorubrum sp. SS7]|nr:hypothetical protein [Halorubrum sp. SS7]